MAKAITISVDSTPLKLLTAGLTGTEINLGPLSGSADLYVGGSDLTSSGSHGWPMPYSVLVKIRLGASEALWAVVPSGGPVDISLLTTDGGLT
jgi:hypothetical protein